MPGLFGGTYSRESKRENDLYRIVAGNKADKEGAMEKIRLGKTNMLVSRIGFGGIPIQRVSDDEAVTVVRRCLELGVNFVDTSNGYTTSEERIGKALSGRHEGLIVSTRSASRNREELATHLELSFRRLGVEYIDLYHFHNVSDFNALTTVTAANGPMAVLKEAKRAGRIKHIGITSHQIDVAKEAVKSGLFETIMFPFNFITCDAADELLPLAREYDVGFIVMKALAGGMLDNVTIAIKYLLQFPDILLLAGIEKVPEIEEVMQIVAGPQALDTTEREEIERLRQELGTQFCHRCDYCQPCPEEIRISIVLTFAPSLSRRAPERLFHGVYAAAMEKAADCTKCGTCEEKCPYHLPIRDMMEEYSNWYQAEKGKYQGEAALR